MIDKSTITAQFADGPREVPFCPTDTAGLVIANLDIDVYCVLHIESGWRIGGPQRAQEHAKALASLLNVVADWTMGAGELKRRWPDLEADVNHARLKVCCDRLAHCP